MVMPDLVSVLFKRWKLIAGITFIAVVIALIFGLLSPKKISVGCHSLARQQRYC